MRNRDEKRKVYLMGRDNVGWSIDQDRMHAEKLIGKIDKAEMTKNILEADLVYCVWYGAFMNPLRYYPARIFKMIRPLKICAVVTNDIENHPRNTEKLKNIIDVWIAANRKNCDYLRSRNLKTELLPFFVDKKTFFKTGQSKKEISESLGIDYGRIKDKFLIGSFQRDSLGSNLQKPKWQKNPDLLAEIARKLPKGKFAFLLAGPRRHYIINKLKGLGIEYVFAGDESFIEKSRDDVAANNAPLEKINLLYNLSDVYIVSSKSEGGPKAVLEASFSRTIIFSTPVGMAPDILHPESIFDPDDLNGIVRKIRKAMENAEGFRKETEYNFNSAANSLNEDCLLRKLRRIIL